MAESKPTQHENSEAKGAPMNNVDVEQKGRESRAANEKAWDDYAGKDGQGVLGYLLSMAIKLLSMPFKIFTEVTRRLMSKVTGEDLVEKVRDAKQELSNLDKTHDQMESGLADRVRMKQQEMSRMHMEEDFQRADWAARQGAMKRDSVRPPGTDSPLPPKQGSDGDYLPVKNDKNNTGLMPDGLLGNEKKSGGMKPGDRDQETQALSPEEFRKELARMFSWIDPRSVSADLVSYDKWRILGESGADSEMIHADIKAKFGQGWEKVFNEYLSKGEDDLTVDDLRECCGALFETVVANDSEQMLRAAKESEDAFQRILLRQFAIFYRAVSDASGGPTPEGLAKAVQGADESTLRLSLEEMDVIDERIMQVSARMNGQLKVWAGKASQERTVDFEMSPQAPEKLLLGASVESRKPDESGRDKENKSSETPGHNRDQADNNEPGQDQSVDDWREPDADIGGMGR